MITDGKIFGIAAQIDFGNFAVGIATFCVAMISFLVAIWSKGHDQRKSIAILREAWIQDVRTKIAEYVSAIARVRTSCFFKNSLKDASAFHIESVSNLWMLRNYVEMKLNKNEKLHVEILSCMSDLYRNAAKMYSMDVKSEDFETKDKINAKIEQRLVNLSAILFNCEWYRIKLELSCSWFREYRYSRRLRRAFEKFAETNPKQNKE